MAFCVADQRPSYRLPSSNLQTSLPSVGRRKEKDLWVQSSEKLLWAKSRQGESPCPSPVLSLEVSHAGSQGKLGKAAHLSAQEEKEVGFMSVSRSLQASKDSLFTFAVL